MRKLACVMIVLIVVFLSGCISSPEPVILSQDAKDSLQGLNWVTVITADIENRGESGNIAVVAEVKRPDKSVMNQQQTVYIGKGEIKKVSFTFDTEFNDKVYYTVTARSSWKIFEFECEFNYNIIGGITSGKSNEVLNLRLIPLGIIAALAMILSGGTTLAQMKFL